MRKKYVVLALLSLALTACSKSDKNMSGEHKDTYSSIYVEPSVEIKEEYYGENGTNTYKVNEDGSIKIDMSYLEKDEDIEVVESDKSQFELNQELNSENTSADTEEVNDIFNLSSQGVTVSSVVNEITKIAERDGFSEVEVISSPETEDIFDSTMEYIVRFDTYDYYILTYHLGEGCVSHHDGTGYLASVYGEQVEDREWVYEE